MGQSKQLTSIHRHTQGEALNGRQTAHRDLECGVVCRGWLAVDLSPCLWTNSPPQPLYRPPIDPVQPHAGSNLQKCFAQTTLAISVNIIIISDQQSAAEALTGNRN